ncbi:MaoC family dehydratase N-terminal domain-containing protein [Mycolicibacterium vaccae]|nr:MaoC family dehydratase N-terminal domain-containing protein [Mycolicibacterium vaccae]
MLPTYALVANWWAVKDLRAVLDVGSSAIVHAAQSLHLERPVTASGEVTVAAEVTATVGHGQACGHRGDVDGHRRRWHPLSGVLTNHGARRGWFRRDPPAGGGPGTAERP